MNNIVETLTQIANMLSQSQTNCICSIISGVGNLSSFGLFILGILTYNVWQKKIKREKFETIKVDLVYNLIDLVSTLKIHCYEDPCVSSKSVSKITFNNLSPQASLTAATISS